MLIYTPRVYSSYFALFMCIIILLTGGFAVFTKGNWNASNFVSAYLYVYPASWT